MNEPKGLSTMDIYTLIYYFIYLFLVAITAFYIYRSLKTPIDAVKIGRQLNDEQENEKRKKDLFLTLFAYRGMPDHFRFVEALNQIEILFHDVPQILTAWYTLYSSLHIGDRVGTAHDFEIMEQNRIVLLDEMASHLKYSSLKQLRIQNAYYPRGYGNSAKFESDLRSAELVFYRTGGEVYQKIIDKTNEDSEAKEKPIPPTQTSPSV
jgi:hypothetical protein